MDKTQLKYVIEAALLAAGRPLNLDRLQGLFGDSEPPARQDIRAVIMDLQADYAERGIELIEVGSGFRIQIRSSMTHRLEKLWEERAPRYSRALLETIAIIAYRQPATRGEIEDIRGVAVSTNIMRTLLERNWVKVVGHRDVPGKPAMFGTTKAFLDYFGLTKLDDLPPLSELKDFEKLNIQLDLPDDDAISAGDEIADGDHDMSVMGSDEVAAESAASTADEEPMVDALPEDSSVTESPERDAGNIASLDEARAASLVGGDVSMENEQSLNDDAPGNVVPLKQP